MVERKAFALYFKDKTVINQIDKKHIHIVYVSEKENYAVLYLDKAFAASFKEKMEKNPLVLSCEESNIPYDKYNF